MPDGHAIQRADQSKATVWDILDRLTIVAPTIRREYISIKKTNITPGLPRLLNYYLPPTKQSHHYSELNSASLPQRKPINPKRHARIPDDFTRIVSFAIEIILETFGYP
jgi:hypothetical protein